MQKSGEEHPVIKRGGVWKKRGGDLFGERE